MMIAGSAIVLMHLYIAGQQVFLFTDIGSDSFYQTYPNIYYTAKCIEEGLTRGVYNFFQGIGDGGGTITFGLSNWYCWFGTARLPYLLGIDHLIKLILSGIFFFEFLETMKRQTWFHLVLALGYAFCGHMVLRSSWTSYPLEVMLVAMWLWGFELWFQRKDIRWLILATAIFTYYRSSSYSMLLYGALGVTYILVRYVTERKIAWKILAAGAAGVLLLVGIYLAVTKNAIFQTVFSMIATRRVQNEIAARDWSIRNFLPNITSYTTVLFRTVGTDIIGGEREYAGVGNMLEDATYYCGLSTLILLPLGFYCMNIRQKVCYAFFYVIAFIYTFCENIRVVANGFANDTYKLSSFWIIVLMLITVARIDWEQIRTRNQRTIAIGCVVIMTMLVVFSMLHAMEKIETLEDRLNRSFLFLGLECGLLLLILLGRKFGEIPRAALALCVCAEVVTFAYPVYNDRDFADTTVYEDGTSEAIEYIEAIDDGFYRVDKQYTTVSLCDSLLQGYRGLASYVGGIGIGEDYLDFCYDTNIICGNDIRLLYEPSGYNEVNTLLGVKYILSRTSIANFGYTQVGKVGEINIYENKYAVPMGFVYHEQISREQFESLSYKQRQQVLLKAFVSDTEMETIPYIEESEIAALDDQFDLTDQYIHEAVYSTEDHRFHFTPNSEDEVLTVRIHFEEDSGGLAYLTYETVDGKEGQMQIIDITRGEEQIFEIDVPYVDRVGITASATFDFIRVSAVPRDLYYQNYVSDMEANMAERLNITVCEPTCMKGTVETKTDGVLYLPIANNTWQILVDGEYASKSIINDAFLGIYLEAGEHTVELTYYQATLWQMYGGVIKKIIKYAVIFIVLTIFMHRRRGGGYERYISRSSGL